MPVVDSANPVFFTFIAGVEDETVGFQQSRRSQVILVRPVRRAGGGAGTAEDTIDRRGYLGKILRRLNAFFIRRRSGIYQVGLDLLQKFEERVHIDRKVLQYFESRQGIDMNRPAFKILDLSFASQAVDPVDLHGATAADAVPAGAAVGQGAVLIPFDVIQGVQYRPAVQNFHLVVFVMAMFIVTPENFECSLHSVF